MGETDPSLRQNEEIVRSMIQSENELINHRISWLTTVQGLLFASLGFAWGKPDSSGLATLLCTLGIAVSVLCFLLLISATWAQNRLVSWWESNKPAEYIGPGVMGLPPWEKSLRWYPILRVFAGWNLFPVVFAAAWIAVLCMT